MHVKMNKQIRKKPTYARNNKVRGKRIEKASLVGIYSLVIVNRLHLSVMTQVNAISSIKLVNDCLWQQGSLCLSDGCPQKSIRLNHRESRPIIRS